MEQASPSQISDTVKSSKAIIAELAEIDPLLHDDWLQRVTPAMAKLNSQQRKFVYAQLLKPKGILLDQETRRFIFNGRHTVASLVKAGLSNMGALAQKVLKAEQSLQATDDVKAFADILEGTLSTIESVDTEDNLQSQNEKIQIRKAFLDDLIPIVRTAPFKPFQNLRSLSVTAIRTYILDVYLKQQLLGYRYKTTPISVLEADPHPFIKECIAPEARMRQCDIVRGESYLFLIGPVKNNSNNPFSLRRFLHEDVGMNGQIVYFNAVAIPLTKLDDEAAQEAIRWLISRIVTLERQVSKDVFNFVHGLEKSKNQYLTPMLNTNFSAEGGSLEQLIDERLANFEQKMDLLFLGKLPMGLNQVAKTLDEFEYLFFNIKHLLIELSCEVRDFTTQSATAWSARAESLDIRLMSYIRLLEKRKDTLFSSNETAKQDPALNHEVLTHEINASLDAGDADIAAAQAKITALVKKQNKGETTFGKLKSVVFGDAKSNTPTIEELQADMSLAKRKSLLALIRIIKRYPRITVNLQFEDVIIVDESVRHYAIAAGKEGITRLPVLLSLYENADQFDSQAMRKSLKESLEESNE